jgi:hypothetical protein
MAHRFRLRVSVTLRGLEHRTNRGFGGEPRHQQEVSPKPRVYWNSRERAGGPQQSAVSWNSREQWVISPETVDSGSAPVHSVPENQMDRERV